MEVAGLPNILPLDPKGATTAVGFAAGVGVPNVDVAVTEGKPDAVGLLSVAEPKAVIFALGSPKLGAVLLSGAPNIDFISLFPSPVVEGELPMLPNNDGVD